MLLASDNDGCLPYCFFSPIRSAAPLEPAPKSISPANSPTLEEPIDEARPGCPL